MRYSTPWIPPNGGELQQEELYTPGDILFIPAEDHDLSGLDVLQSDGTVLGGSTMANFGENVEQVFTTGNTTDLAVGAPYNSSVRQTDRRTLLWYITEVDPKSTVPNVEASAWVVDKPYDDSDWLGPQFGVVGDVTGDGNDDIALILDDMAVLPGPIDQDVPLEGWDLWIGGAQVISDSKPALVQRFDANGDGVYDLAPARAGGGDGAGRLRIFLGPIDSSRETADQDVILGMFSYSPAHESSKDGDSTDFGRSALSSPGDRDGDGYDDLVIADRWRDIEGTTDAGKIWLLAGPFLEDGDIESLAYATVVGVNDRDEIGAYAAEGDLNGDGATDLVAAANNWQETDPYSGWPTDEATDPGTRLFWGPIGGTVPFDHGVEIHNSRAGELIANVDLDGDGVDDLVMTDNDLAGSDDDPMFPTAIHIWYSSASSEWPRPWAPSD
ncbi:MAG: hypothetical protein H6742_22130 [Alphaproteobacteria bacterium]|nr:hypothetical protein [Alphaproteobacteria bacterium]